MSFKVTEVIDGDTFDVSPGWKWKKSEGKRVRPTGYNTPEKEEPYYQEKKDKLKKLILNKEVELKNAIKIIDGGRLLCDVYYEGKNLAEYFPECK